MAWSWRTLLTNPTGRHLQADILLAQDLGLSDEAAVRNNEAFTSQYIDLLPVEDEHKGWAILARQNQAASGGKHPWLAIGCEHGAVAFCTDGTQFFGEDHRFVCVPLAVRTENLPSIRLQYECAMAALQSRAVGLEAGCSAEIGFVARYICDHPAPSSNADLALLWESALPDSPGTNSDLGAGSAPMSAPMFSLFVNAPWLHGDKPESGDWADWFPGAIRNEEYAADGSLLAFFHGPDTHVVSREKEADMARPHGHILRSGTWRWVDNEQFGTTCYAAGIFSAQAYLGNTTFGRLLPVVRSALGLGRAAGQRVFVWRDGAWHQLGIPSAFVMTPRDARWIYRLGDEIIEARTWCSRDNAAAFLELRVTQSDKAVEFLITHVVSLGANEFEHPGKLVIDHDDSWVACEPDPMSMIGSHFPGACFAIASAEPDGTAEFGGAEMLSLDRRSEGHPCVAIRTGKVTRFGAILCGTNAGRESLAKVVEAARGEWSKGCTPSAPPPASIRLSGAPSSSRSVARIDEILTWLNHNAAVHFSAPHGLEQQGGAAWGVRDVCQGSVEWLLAACDWPLVRRILLNVFSKQYARDGSWPQWYMHPPYHKVQQAHSHGDVCFWPLKALCDYLEASNDMSLLDFRVGYTDPESFVLDGPEESLLRHCDRVIDQCEARFVDGTALVNFGDGDWDDTLQPADPEIQARMISSWTVALVYQTFRQLAAVFAKASQLDRLARLQALLKRMRDDFSGMLMPDSTVAGFLVKEADGSTRPLLHPSDRVTGIRYRLLPMTRAILAELFTPGESIHHLAIMEKELVYPDGARLMSEPAIYRGGLEFLFKRADTAANVGREIGLQYVHAHLRYAEAMAKVGQAERLWTALQVVNPVGLQEVLANAAPRQSNMYFSSSDADFADRLVAARRWTELKAGSVEVRGGWRLYSSGPGLFIHAIRTCLLGLREHFGEVIFDPVLPKSLNGLSAMVTLCHRPVEMRFQVEGSTFAPTAIIVNGVRLEGGRREGNPYRKGGLCFKEEAVSALLRANNNELVVHL